MQSIARAFEAVDIQMRSMEQEWDQERPTDDKEEVNAVEGKRKWKGKRGDIGRGHESRAQSNHDFKCYRCNQSGYFARDLMCPARDEICKQCGRRDIMRYAVRHRGLEIQSRKERQKTKHTTYVEVGTNMLSRLKVKEIHQDWSTTK